MKAKKLTLHRQTVRLLTSDGAARAWGGAEVPRLRTFPCTHPGLCDPIPSVNIRC